MSHRCRTRSAQNTAPSLSRSCISDGGAPDLEHEAGKTFMIHRKFTVTSYRSHSEGES